MWARVSPRSDNAAKLCSQPELVAPSGAERSGACPRKTGWTALVEERRVSSAVAGVRGETESKCLWLATHVWSSCVPRSVAPFERLTQNKLHCNSKLPETEVRARIDRHRRYQLPTWLPFSRPLCCQRRHLEPPPRAATPRSSPSHHHIHSLQKRELEQKAERQEQSKTEYAELLVERGVLLVAMNGSTEDAASELAATTARKRGRCRQTGQRARVTTEITNLCRKTSQLDLGGSTSGPNELD